MKKTNKSPENNEVTPNKKKLKQARLPFMPLSDDSPKAETPPSRKRKLSVPEPVPATKVGKLSKENGIAEELVVISDEDSKGIPSPKKQDKVLNPYVNLVDAARKKKLQKSKGAKKSKSRSNKKETSNATENVSLDEKTENHESEDVEKMDVDDAVDQDIDKDTDKSGNNISNDAKSIEDNNNTKNKESDSNSKDEKVSPQKSPQKDSSSPRKSSKGKQVKATPKTLKKSKTVEIIAETICLDDSNNSADVQITKSSKDTKISQETESKDASLEQALNKQPEKSKESPIKQNTSSKEPEDKVLTPKRSTRNLNKNVKESKTESSDKDKSYNKETQPKTENSQKDDDSDIEMIEETPKELEITTENKESVKEKLHKDNDSDIEMIEEIPNESKTTKEAQKSLKSSQEDTKSKSDGPVTPKRSLRKKPEGGENLNMSTGSTLDESMASNPSTPKADKSLNESLKNLTPKQMAKKIEAAKKRDEREKEKQEREKKRQQEKEERAKQRQEREDQKKREREEKEEAKKKEREEKEEQRKKEKEEKEKQKELERKAREEKEEAKKKEREEKEEQKKKEKEAKEEERRKKQEALELEKQEQELKLKKTKEAFVSFFVPKQKADKETLISEKPISKNSMLSSFTIKVDMRLAPTCRVDLDVERREALEKLMEEQNPEKSYLKNLKNGAVKPGCCGKTWPLGDKDDDVMIVEDELPPIDDAGEVITCESGPREKLRPKLLSFHENRRPPYWGTWRKKSEVVKPRRPFGQEKILDYEVDSDDDWEDEADGESLDGSAGGSDDEAGADDYEVDNEVFVPHGYLSDEEATMDEEDDVLSLSPETQKARLKHLEDEFESEMKKPTEKLKPRLYGILWETQEGGKPEKCVDALWNYFEKFALIANDDITPLLQPAPEPEKEQEKKKIKKKKALTDGETNEQSPKSKKKKEDKADNKEKKPKTEVKKSLPNQPGINSFLKKVNTS